MEYVEIYTDGSSSNNKTFCGGWSAILLYKDKEKQIYGGEPPKETNQTMEMLGVIKALEELRTTRIPVRIYSDSAYIVNCFKEQWYVNWRKNGWRNAKKKPVENKELWERMIELFEKQNDIAFCKVKGHDGDKYNEIADKLAVKGRYEIEEELGLR
jgi:ribonuclease HI